MLDVKVNWVKCFGAKIADQLRVMESLKTDQCPRQEKHSIENSIVDKTCRIHSNICGWEVINMRFSQVQNFDECSLAINLNKQLGIIFK